jgi:chromosome segregation ATPase
VQGFDYSNLDWALDAAEGDLDDLVRAIEVTTDDVAALGESDANADDDLEELSDKLERLATQLSYAATDVRNLVCEIGDARERFEDEED